MKIYSVNDREFQKYGRVLSGYDFTELFEKCRETVVLPDEGFDYFPSHEEMEALLVAEELRLRAFGGMPIQIGSVFGRNNKMGCLEYHKSSELNISLDKVILVLGCESELEDLRFDSAKAMAFEVPAETGVELFGTTLHYAPISTSESGYRVICVLPKGTNGPKPEILTEKGEDRLCMGRNKWLLAHADSPEARAGAYVGIDGEIITI